MKQQGCNIESDIQSIYDDQVGIQISHVYYKNFYGRIRFYEDTNLIMMQSKMFKQLFFKIHDNGITEIKSLQRLLALDQQSQIIQMQSKNLILISRKDDYLDIIDIAQLETLASLKLPFSSQHQGFQLLNKPKIFLLDKLKGHIRGFCLLREKFTIKLQFKEFIRIQDSQIKLYQLHLQSQHSIYILVSKTLKIINKQQKNKIFINCLTEIIAPNHQACKNIDLLKIPSISELKNIRYNFIQWLYIDSLKLWCILQDDFLSIFNKNFQLLQQIVIKMNYKPLNLQYDSQGLKIFYKMKRKY